MRMLRQSPTAGFAIPFLERLGGNLPLDEQLRELSTLRLTLERHKDSRSESSQSGARRYFFRPTVSVRTADVLPL